MSASPIRRPPLCPDTPATHPSHQRRRHLLQGLLALGSGLLLPSVPAAAPLHPAAQASSSSASPHGHWPQKAVRLIVPTAPGTPPDRIARAVAEPMGRLLGHSVIPENRPGNHGNLAATLVARAPADGYTLLLGTETMPGINALLPGRTPFDPGEQLLGINRIATAPFLLVVGTHAPFHSLRALLHHARRQPLGYGCHGTASASQLAVEWLRQKTRARHLGFNDFSSPQRLIRAVAEGEISLACLPARHLALVQEEERVRIIAITRSHADPLVPGAPGIQRLDRSPPHEFLDWTALFAPRRTPRALIGRLDEVLRQALQGPQLAASLSPLGFTPAPAASPEQFQQDFTGTLARNRALLGTLDLRPAS